jgi:hypothetical protein
MRRGTKIPALGRTDARYRIADHDENGFWIERIATGSRARVTWSKVRSTLARLVAGTPVNFQGNAGKHLGIDGTSAIRDGILWALSDVAERQGKVVVITDLAAAVALLHDLQGEI